MVDPSGEEIRKRAVELEANAYAGKTKSTRSSQEKRYLSFCEKYSVSPVAPSIRDIVMYIAYLSFWMVYTSVINYMSCVSNFLKANGSRGIDYSDFHIKQALRGLRRLSSGGRGKARPLFPDDLRLLFNVLNLNLYDDLLFWSAVTLCYRCLFRISNLCGVHALMVSHVKFTGEGLTVEVASSKTNQFGDYCQLLMVRENLSTPLCPVRWLRRLLRGHTPNPNVKLFRVKRGEVFSPMSYEWFRNKLSATVAKAGLDGTRVTTHSLRRGSTSFMRSIGYDLCDIKRRGGWSSNTVLGYIDELPGTAWVKDRLFSDQFN